MCTILWGGIKRLYLSEQVGHSQQCFAWIGSLAAYVEANEYGSYYW
jgi:hypothetical protein